MLLLRVHVDGVQTHLSCAAGLPLVLHRCGDGEEGHFETFPASLSFTSESLTVEVHTLTVLIHARLQALLQPACLALITVSFVHRTHPGPSLAPVGPDRTLKVGSTQN